VSGADVGERAAGGGTALGRCGGVYKRRARHLRRFRGFAIDVQAPNVRWQVKLYADGRGVETRESWGCCWPKTPREELHLTCMHLGARDDDCPWNTAGEVLELQLQREGLDHPFSINCPGR
jgi:hypothetical protein